MKRLIGLLALLLVACLATPSYAAWNIRQKDTGAAVLTDGNSVDVPLSGDTIIVQLSNLTVPGSTYVTTHHPGKIKKVYIVGSGKFGTGLSSPTFTFKATTGAGNAVNQFRAVSSGATLTMLTTAEGLASTLTFNDVTNDVTQGSVIAIISSGSAAPFGATITIVIE